MNPVDLQDAIDFLNKNERGQFTHSFLVNENNVCTICGKGGDAHNQQDNLNLLDDILINKLSNSHRFRQYENTYRNSLGKDKTDKEDKKNNDKNEIECGICFERIENSSTVY